MRFAATAGLLCGETDFESEEGPRTPSFLALEVFCCLASMRADRLTGEATAWLVLFAWVCAAVELPRIGFEAGDSHVAAAVACTGWRRLRSAFMFP